MTVGFLLVVIVVLLYRRRPGRDYTPGVMVLIAALLWLAIRIQLVSMIGDLFTVAVQHWIQVVIALASLVLLIVPAVMIYVALGDQFKNRANFPEPACPVRSKFERRVATLMALGYARTQAEVTAIRQLQRDFHHTYSAQPSSRNRAERRAVRF